MVIIDGRTDLEKFQQLRNYPEGTNLEFKSNLDLRNSRDKLNLVKDIVSMGNRPSGGYIILGLDDDANLVLEKGSIENRGLFDGASLGSMVRQYIEPEIHISSQFHEIDEYEIVVILVHAHQSGLPVPFSKDGQYQDARNRTKSVFREGDLVVREGPQNVAVRFKHWEELLASYAERIRVETRQNLDALVVQLAKSLTEQDATGRVISLPLSLEMPLEAFVNTVENQLLSGVSVRIEQFLQSLASSNLSQEKEELAIERVSVLAVQALWFQKQDVARSCVGYLVRSYSQGETSPEMKLQYATYAYIVGAFALRTQQWTFIRELVLQNYRDEFGTYVWASWIRHAQVAASRANLFPPQTGGMMITLARKILATQGTLRPDIDEDGLPAIEAISPDDELLNSLAQFDFLYCLLVEVEGKGMAGGYPASASGNQRRVDPILINISTDARVRHELFGQSDDLSIARGIRTVFNSARNESLRYAGYWSELPPSVGEFIGPLLGSEA